MGTRNIGETVLFVVALLGGLIVASVANAAEQAADAPAKSYITSWNVCSKQFIDPPVFRVLPLPATNRYCAEVTQGSSVLTVSSRTPILDLKRIWRRVAISEFQLRLLWLDKDGRMLHEEVSKRVKAPDFGGFHEPPADWAAAADRNVAYLIQAADHGSAPYREPGVPVWIWSSAPDYHLSYPCLMISNLTWGFLAHVDNHGPYASDALRLARAGADWGLKNRTPDAGALPLFPYSTVTKGQMGGALEGDAVNLLRASRLAASYVDLFNATGHQPYLDYARHIADVTVRFQNPDGSFAYRVNPTTGVAVEMYNPNVMEFIELVEKLEPHGFEARRALAAQRALEWLLSYVAANNNWKAVYEDVDKNGFYDNLSQMAVQPLIHYLCLHKDSDPRYLPMARRLNRWVEDQFVTFGLENKALPVRDRGPLVFEQFVCWWPMEGHTSRWILTLIDLHKATGDVEYLNKAKAAANAICRDQYPDGQFSTWGRDWETGKTAMEGTPSWFPGLNNWYNANAAADEGLYGLTAYVRSLEK